MTAPAVEMTHKLTPSFRIASALIAAEEYIQQTLETYDLSGGGDKNDREVRREGERVLNLISEARDSD